MDKITKLLIKAVNHLLYKSNLLNNYISVPLKWDELNN